MIEELARAAAWDYQTQAENIVGPDIPRVAVPYRNGFEAGFRKAREMAAQASDLVLGQCCDQSCCAGMVSDAIKKIGEGEVNE